MPRDRETFHHGDLRNALVRAAVELLAADDPSALTLREVARRAGVSSGAPYHHFASRTELLAAVAVEGFAALEPVLAKIDAGSRPPRDRLERRIRAYVEFARAHAAHYRVMFHDELRAAGSEAYRDTAQRAFAALVAAVAAVRPELSERRWRELAITVWAGGHGLVMLGDSETLAALSGRGSDARAIASSARALADMVATAEP